MPDDVWEDQASSCALEGPGLAVSPNSDVWKPHSSSSMIIIHHGNGVFEIVPHLVATHPQLLGRGDSRLSSHLAAPAGKIPLSRGRLAGAVGAS